MERKQFIEKSLKLGISSCVLSSLIFNETKAVTPPDDQELTACKGEKDFMNNWLSDLFDSMEKTVDRETQVKIIEGCGRGCFSRHQFKHDIVDKGKGSLDNLIEAYKQNFEIWKEEDKVHIRYGEISPGCYCPAAKNREAKPDDLHCECSRTSHQTIFETALGKPFKVDIAESVRRGAKTCHFIVHLT